MTRSDWLWLGAYTLAIAAASVCAYALAVGDRVPSGDVIPFSSTKIKPTPAEDPEQRFHWCTVAGRDTGHTLCLYVPQGGV